MRMGEGAQLLFWLSELLCGHWCVLVFFFFSILHFYFLSPFVLFCYSDYLTFCVSV